MSRPPFAALTQPLASVEEMRQRIRRQSQLKGRQTEDAAMAEVRLALDGRALARDLLIENLHALNDAFCGLHDRHLVALAKQMNLAMAEVYEVATFYHHFEVLRGDALGPTMTVRVCDGLSCELAGSSALLASLQVSLDAEFDTQGGGVRVIAAPCIGRCEQAPAALVQQYPLPFATIETVTQAVNGHIKTHPVAADDGQFEPGACTEQPVVPALNVQVSPAFVGLEAYRQRGGYAVLSALADARLQPDDVLKAMEDSGLRGLGGAGFPAGRKWRIVRDQPASRLMAVNIDEGEPGTFKDRTYLERDPHRFLEGMLVAARVVGIESCYIYLRDEYHGCRAILEAEVARLRANPPCALPMIELRRGAGAYICGEESAMIQSIEGKRGEPRMRPPYIAQVGLFGRPTLVHNFETLYWVRDIIERGPQWFSSFGRQGRKGLRSFSVSGRVNRPGVKLAPAGISINELIKEYCGGMQDGHTLYAYLPGGASGGILPASLADLALDFDTLQPYGCFIGSAAVIVLSDQDKARDAARNIMRFFAHESCGQCTPCRVGTVKAVALLDAPVWDNETLDDLNTVMADASICGLGQAAPNPVRCVQQYFADEIGAR